MNVDTVQKSDEFEICRRDACDPAVEPASSWLTIQILQYYECDTAKMKCYKLLGQTKGFAFSSDRNVACTGFRPILALTEHEWRRLRSGCRASSRLVSMKPEFSCYF
jgi:hypothetical protein